MVIKLRPLLVRTACKELRFEFVPLGEHLLQYPSSGVYEPIFDLDQCQMRNFNQLQFIRIRRIRILKMPLFYSPFARRKNELTSRWLNNHLCNMFFAFCGKVIRVPDFFSSFTGINCMVLCLLLRLRPASQPTESTLPFFIQFAFYRAFERAAAVFY